MSSSQGYLHYILDCLNQCPQVTHRAMMGEYILYVKGKVFGGIYDDRFLVKNVPAAARLMPEALLELPYEGANPMLLVTEEDPEFLRELLGAMEPELPAPKKRSIGSK